MSLYEGLGLGYEEKNESAEAKWSSGLKLLHSQIQLKKVTQPQVKKEKIKLAPPMAGGPSLSNSTEQLNPIRFEPNSLPFLATGDDDESSSRLFGEIFVKSEYNPQYPSDYYKEAERLKQKSNSRMCESLGNRSLKRHEDKVNMTSDHRLLDESSVTETKTELTRAGGVAIAPPPSLIQEDSRPLVEAGTLAMPSSSKLDRGINVAANIMKRYGYKQGQGLGKTEQGMSTALMVEKTSKRGGKIIHEKDVTIPGTSAQPEPITEILKKPSKVILLKNMVSPGEVDEELEDEVKEELMTKYGQVSKVTIFEMPELPEDEAVRIFVEFSKVETAIKAVVDLNGRYFGGRLVLAGFYDLDKFAKFARWRSNEH